MVETHPQVVLTELMQFGSAEMSPMAEAFFFFKLNYLKILYLYIKI